MEYDTRSDEEFEVVEIARNECWEYVEPVQVKTLSDGRVLLIVDEEQADSDNLTGTAAWQGETLRVFAEYGYVATSASKTHLWLMPVGMQLPKK